MTSFLNLLNRKETFRHHYGHTDLLFDYQVYREHPDWSLSNFQWVVPGCVVVLGYLVAMAENWERAAPPPHGTPHLPSSAASASTDNLNLEIQVTRHEQVSKCRRAFLGR